MTNHLNKLWGATRSFRPVMVLLVVAFIVFAVSQDNFATWSNIQNLLTSVSVLWIISMGMTLVLLTGGVDLSVAAIGSLAGVFLAKLLDQSVPAGVALALAVLFGAVVGAVINGVPIGRLGLSFFVVTLASMIALTGVVSLWSNTESEFVSAPLINDIAVGHLLGLPGPVWLMIATFLICLFVQRCTYFGRDVYAVGGSIVASRLSGIRVPRTLIAVYAASGAFAALAGLLAVGRIGATSPQVDNGIALSAVAAVLLGGTSLFGGAGGVGGTALGVLFIGVLQNGLSIAGVQSFWQQVVTGVILVAAVLGDRLQVSGGGARALRTMFARGMEPVVDTDGQPGASPQ